MTDESEAPIKKRRDKDAPIEKSSKSYVSRFQVVVPTSGKVVRVSSELPVIWIAIGMSKESYI